MSDLSRAGVVVVALLFLVAACERAPEPKPLGERLLDRLVQRCKAMASKGTEDQCVVAPGTTTREALRKMHQTLMTQGRTMFPRDGHCDIHGVFMICNEKIGDKTTSIMYRIDDAKDGSDSKVLSVWSMEW